MINIVTRTDSKKVIHDADSLFYKYILARNFTDLELEVMHEIDSAVLLDCNFGTIKTKFGVTDIYHLSTGCKIVLFYIYMQTLGKTKFKDNILEITECGGNALKCLFSCVEVLGDSTSTFLLRQSTQIRVLKDVQALVNGHMCDSLYRGLRQYGEWV